MRDQYVEPSLFDALMQSGVPTVLLTGAFEANERTVEGHHWAAVMRHPVTVGSVTDKVQEIAGGGSNIPSRKERNMADHSKKISPVSRDQWPQTINMFNNMNKGRAIKVERYGGGKPHEHMAEGSPLFSMTYNPPDKGDAITIALGRETVEYEHRVDAPKELWVLSATEEKGEAMEIVDGEGSHVSISLE